ncbi:MAG: hypothetical protein JJU33_05385 [Phycisphaerales bacterium]|nr:hypothetical protein [Phycisphaerales bacterium]
MPRYEYRCESTHEIVEVSHPMSETLRTWGEVCERAGIDPGKTPAKTPVEKVVSLASIGGAGPSGGPSAGQSGGAPPHSCGPGCCMGG